MQQLLISVLVRGSETVDTLPELYAQALAMGVGQKMMHEGIPVHLVTAAQSPLAIDPRELGLKDVMAGLTAMQKMTLQKQIPSVWLALQMLVDNEENKMHPIMNHNHDDEVFQPGSCPECKKQADQ